MNVSPIQVRAARMPAARMRSARLSLTVFISGAFASNAFAGEVATVAIADVSTETSQKPAPIVFELGVLAGNGAKFLQFPDSPIAVRARGRSCCGRPDAGQGLGGDASSALPRDHRNDPRPTE